MTSGIRLKEERERLGLSQSAFAELAGSGKHAQIKWEKGETFPNVSALEAWAAVGLDVLYLVTGERQKNMLASDPAEQVLIESYRRCKPEARQHLIQTAALLSAGLGSIGSLPGGPISQVMRNNGSGSVQVGHVEGSINTSAGRKAAVRKSRPPSR